MTTNKELATLGLQNTIVAISREIMPERVTKKAMVKSWDDISTERVTELMGKYSSAVEAHGNATLPGPIEDDSDKKNVANELRWLEHLEALVKRRKEFLKDRVYDTFDAENLDLPEVKEGAIPVTHTKGRLEVELDDALVTASRGGGGRKDATVDFAAMEEALGTETFREIATKKVRHRRQIIAAHTTYEPDLDVLGESLAEGKITIEQLRNFVTPGDLKPVRYTVTVKAKA